MNLITIQDIKDYTSISNQVDPKFLEPYISTAEDIHVEPVLGSAFTQELKDLLDAVSGVTGTTGHVHTLLVKYIRPCMLWFTTVEALPFLDKKIKNSSIVKSAGEGSTNLDQEEYNDFEQVIKDKAFFYRDRLVTYLNDNTGLFTSYGNAKAPKNNSIGIYLGSF